MITAAAGRGEPAVATTEGVQPEDSVETKNVCKLFSQGNASEFMKSENKIDNFSLPVAYTS